MKNKIPLNSFILLLFGLCLNFNLLAFNEAHSGLSTTEHFTNNASTLLPCDVPGGLHTTNITETSATFNWSAVSGAQSYSVQTRLPGGAWYYVPGSPFMMTSATVNWFDPGTTYEWRVRANCGYGYYSYWSAPMSFTTQGSFTCDIPWGLNTYNITQTTATWDWEPAAGAVSYSVQWRYAGGTWYNLNGGPWSGTSLNVGGLQPGTNYEWRVRSNCSNGESSPWSAGESFSTLSNSCETPTGLYTTNITESSATFNWSPVSGAQNYSVQIRLPWGTWNYISGSPFNNTTATVNYLDAGTTYEWRVRSNCGYGNSSYWSAPISFTTSGSYSCAAPDQLNTYNITQTSATWDWSAVSGALSYSIQWRYAGGTWNNLPGGPWYNSVLNVSGLQPGTDYEWRVKSNCSNGATSDWSLGASFTTLTTTCSTPTGLYTTNVTESSATFNWSPVSGAQNYSVQIRLPWGSWSYISGSPFNGTSASVYNLSPNTTYEWRVRANCSYGVYSYWSSPVSFTTSGSFACTAPTDLATYNITQTTATWDWSPVSGAISYAVQWRYAGGTWYNLPGGPWTGTALNIGGLQPGTAYEWRVRSNCSNWMVSDWSVPSAFTTQGSTCATPTGLYTSNVTESSATFNWDPVAGAQSYSVQIRLPWGSWTYISGSPFNGTSATVYNLSPGTTYEWRVRANCSYGYYSYWSAPMSFTTNGSFSCEAPYQLATYNITQTTATWDWEPVSGAINYSVQWRYAGGTWYNLQGGPWSGTSLNVGGLQPGTAYEWRVRSNCGNGVYSVWSAGESFTTLGSSCNTPTGLYTTNITESSATFNWSMVSGAQSYSVQIRLPWGNWSYIPGSPFANTSATVYNLSPGTTYEWRVRANCSYGDYSLWTAPMSFTTTGSGQGYGNDNCSDATLLTVNSVCINTASSNINATASTPPPVGGCYSNAYKDVWFRFTMPMVSNPLVTIRTTAGSLADAVMEVYTASNCSNMSYITCEDNNNNGNGSSMPVVTITGAPGETIWVRVWGYNGATGTFSICVFDYQSNDFVEDDGPAIPVTGEHLEEVSKFEPTSNDDTPLYRVAPNPASDMLHVTYTQSEESIVTNLVMTDMSGQIVMKKEYDSRDMNVFNDQLDVSQLVPGMYILQIVTTKGIVSEKVTVVK